MTKVVNKYKNEYDVYIGCGSIWGNPFVIGVDGTREEVIDKYKEYLINNKYLMSRIQELKDKTLGCFCKTAKCHGDVLAEIANKL